MDDWRKEQFDRLKKVGYLDAYSEMLRRMNVPFWWSGLVVGQSEVLNNGTICYVDTGSARVGITADHVYSKYVEQKAAIEDVELQLGENTINLEDFLIDRDPAIDIATFRIPEVFVSAGGAHYHSPPKWPPDPVEEREVVVHGGYPQVLRNPKTGTVEFPFQYFVTRVNDVKPLDIVIEPSPENVYTPGADNEPVNTLWHGQSGGPVYRVIDANLNQGGNEVIDRVELVGIIYRQLMDLVIARPIRFVGPDGTIIRPTPTS